MIIILLGAPGAGKGTQANLLAEKFDLRHLETSHLIKRVLESKRKGKIIDSERKRWKAGKLNSTPFALQLVKEKTLEWKDENGIVFSGSPRTIEEAESLLPFLAKLFGKKNISVFFINISVKESVFRNSHRKICELMRHPILYSQENERLNHCPFDGSLLIKRDLDTPETIKKRFKVFEKETLPVLNTIKKMGFNVQTINGSPSVTKVFENILRTIKFHS